MPNLKVLGCVCYGCHFGPATLVVSDRFSKKNWRSEERCTAVLFGSVFVMAVCAPDCHNDLDVHEKFVKDATRILREGCRAGPKKFYVAGDLNVELWLLCARNNDFEELTEMYGPWCWQGYNTDQEADVVRDHEGVQL